MPMKIQGNDYLKVVERLEMLVKERKKDYAIETSFKTINDHILIFKAILTIEGRQYTGHSMCDIAEGKPKIAEKTETCAIGRALSSYGLHGGNFASADEMLDFQEQTKTTQIKRETTKTKTSKDIPATEKQLFLIGKKCEELALAKSELITEGMTVSEASDVISDLIENGAKNKISLYQERVEESENSTKGDQLTFK